MKDKCPYCKSTSLSLKQNEWNYYRYRCDMCHKYFAIWGDKIIKISV